MPYKKFFLSFILGLVCLFKVNAQTDHVIISGSIRNDSVNLSNVHVINKTSNRGTLSDQKGFFHIRVKENDTLIFSEISHQIRQLVIDTGMIQKKEIEVQLVVLVNKLDEVVIFKNKQLTNPLGLPNWGKKPLNKVERELNFYSQKSLPIIILETIFGKVGGINDIWYVVSGNRKKFRYFEEIKRQDELNAYNLTVCQEIRKHFGDDFFKTTLKIDEKNIEQYLLFCVSKNIVTLFEEKRELELMDILISQTSHFKTNK